MEWYKQLANRWSDESLLPQVQGVDEGALSDFEVRYSVRLPEEVRLYFQSLNGMSVRGGHDVDENGFSFLPLASVRSVAEFSAAMNWTVEGDISKDTAFVFVDYLQWSCAYAFETSTPHRGAIYLLGFAKPKLIAPSLKEFVGMYLADDPLLYQAA